MNTDEIHSQACREFVNRNSACLTPNKSPELLAKFSDSLLKKSNKANEDADIDAALGDTVRSFNEQISIGTDDTLI
jgi:cullin 1